MKLLKLFLLIICSLFACSIQSQSLPYKGLYIDSFNSIVGIQTEEDSLLNYLKDSSYNAIICYNISSVISSDQSSIKNKNLAAFIKRAKTQYGIKYVMASSESYNTHLTLTVPYNKYRTDVDERFTHLYLEFEFWNKNNTANGGYYCTNYLSPKGYSCDTAGAFKFYKKMSISLDSIANLIGCKSATYVGNPNLGQAKFIASNFDFILCDNYTSNTSNIYLNVKTNFSNFGSTSKVVDIVPIFASYSPGGVFLGDYLRSNSESSVYSKLFLPRYNAETGTWKSKINLMGYQWYRYSGMPHNGNYNCDVPYGLLASNVTNSSVIISWFSDSPMNYMFKYRIAGGTEWQSITTTENFVTLINLPQSTTYEVCIIPICIPVSAKSSEIISFTTFGCSIPGGIVTSNVTSNSFDVKWNNITGSTGYILQYRILGETLWQNTSTVANNISITNLSPLTNYEFKIKSICNSLNSDYSDIFTVKTLNLPCQLPNLTYVSPTTTSLTFNWLSISTVISYNLNIRKKGATTWSSFSTTDNSKNLSSLLASTSYEYQIQSICQDGVSQYSPISIANTAQNTTNCLVPKGIYVDNILSSSVDINFSIVNGSSSYTIQYRKFGSSKWSSINTYFLKKTISSLSSLTKYEFKIKSNCSGNNGVYSSIYVFITK